MIDEDALRHQIAQEILSYHTPEDNTTPCAYWDCTHEEDAAIALGESFDDRIE